MKWVRILYCKVSGGWGSLSTWVCTVYLNVCSCLVRFLLLSQILFYLNLSWMFLLRFRVYISNCFNHVSVSLSSVGACVKICIVILLSRDCFLQDVCVLGFYGQ